MCCLIIHLFLENHRLETSYQNHLVLKVLVVSQKCSYISNVLLSNVLQCVALCSICVLN